MWRYVKYGNTGCRVFKRGIQMWRYVKVHFWSVANVLLWTLNFYEFQKKNQKLVKLQQEVSQNSQQWLKIQGNDKMCAESWTRNTPNTHNLFGPPPKSARYSKTLITYPLSMVQLLTPQLIGRLFSPSQKLKKWTHPFRLCFELGMGIYAKY